jgi:glycosyltransferase involved in cell wall biosynthesis
VFLAKDRQAYDLVHCFETRPATIYPAMAYARRHHLPLLTDWNDWFGRGGLVNVLRPRWYQNTLAWIETYYEEAFRERAAGTTVISSALGLRAQKLGIPPDRICLITGGTNPTLFPTRPMDDCRTHMGYPLDCPILGFASADSHLDLDIVLAALAIVAGRYPNVKLIITGKISQTTLEAAQRSGVMEHLIFPGFIPAEELSWCLGSANILLLPYPETIYNLGRWPNKLGLYFSLGRPVVTNPVGDVKRLFDDQPVGLTTDATPQAFAEGIINLIEQPDLARQMGQAAEQVALNQLNWKNLIGELESFYYKILEGKDKHS